MKKLCTCGQLKIWLAVCSDRHEDLTIKVFDSVDKATDFAESFVHENAKSPEYILENTSANGLYVGSFSCEGDDFAYVEESELNFE